MRKKMSVIKLLASAVFTLSVCSGYACERVAECTTNGTKLNGILRSVIANDTKLNDILYSVIASESTTENHGFVSKNLPAKEIKVNPSSISDVIKNFMDEMNSATLVTGYHGDDLLRSELQKVHDDFDIPLNVDVLIDDSKQHDFEIDTGSQLLCEPPQAKQSAIRNNKNYLDDFFVGMGNTSLLTIELLPNNLLRKTKVSDYSKAAHIKRRNVIVMLVKPDKTQNKLKK